MVRAFHRRQIGLCVVWTLFLCCGFSTMATAAQPTNENVDLNSEDLPDRIRKQKKGDTLRLGKVQLDNRAPAEVLQLERFNVFTDEAEIVIHGKNKDDKIPTPKNAYYRGKVEGDPSSQAFLVLHEKGRLRGVIKKAGQFFLMEGAGNETRLTGPPQIQQIDQSTELRDQPFQCGNVPDASLTQPNIPELLEPEIQNPSELQSPVTAALTTGYTARIAIETDYEFFQKFANAAAAIDYIGDLIGYSSTVYEAEINTSLIVSHISLWSTSSDPWEQASSTACGMFEFGRYWNNNRTGITRTTAHFLSGKSLGGGIAWVGVLCNGSFNANIGTSCSGMASTDNYGGAYGYSASLAGNFNINSPSLVWDALVVAHELGHNFNSPHTHCYGGLGGNASPVDQCYGSQTGAGCFVGTPSLPGPSGQGSGTIMSYCHLLSPGYSNISFTFGKDHPHGVAPSRVPAMMSQHVADRAAAFPSCLAPQSSQLSVTANAGGEAIGSVTFSVVLGTAVPGGFTINYATANRTATAGSDYTTTSGTLTFTGNANEVRTITVPIVNDTAIDPNETFIINFSNISNAAVTFTPFVTGTITDNDSAVLSVADVKISEATAAATFSVKLSAAVAGGFTINYATANGTATVNSDYTTTSGTLTFTGTANEVRTISVPLLNDTVIEQNETFFVNFSNISQGTVTFDNQAVGTILNDDGPTLKISDVSQTEGNAGTTAFTFTVTLSPVSTGTVTVTAASANGGALAGSDYTAFPATQLTFAPNQPSQTVTVNVNGDTTNEINELFVVNLSNASGATIFDSQGVGTILNDDGPTLRINDVSQAEGNSGTTAFTFTVTLSSASSETVTVNAVSANGTAAAGSDYTALASTPITFSPGQTSKPVTVNVTGDTAFEANETFFVNLSSAVGATILDSQGVGTITNDDNLSLSINDVSLAEGHSGTTVFNFTVTLSATSSGPVSVNVATANGTALAGSDYTALPSTLLTFAAGQTSKTVTVNVTGETTSEANETFVVNLSGATGATIADNQGVGTIIDDDTPTLRISDFTQTEGTSGNKAFVFTVTMSSASSGTVTVNAATADGSAVAGSDYTALSSTPLTFTPGQTSKTVTVNVTGDTTIEANETFVVNLSGATGGATIVDNQGVGTILNDDGPTLKINDVSQAEGHSGTTVYTFTVTLSPASQSVVTVTAASANGGALAGSDYTALPPTQLTFAAGETSRTVTVNVTGDTATEVNELFVVNLSSPTGATIQDGLGVGTILNDDGPTLSINNVGQAEGNSGTTAYTFTVTLSSASSGTVTVNAVSANGTAAAGSDYTALPSTPLTFTAGQTSKTITVNASGDTTVEANETFVVNLSSAVGATIFDSQGVGTITNDD